MTIIDKLNEWGADTELGIRRCANNKDLYLRLVKMLNENEGFSKLEETINNNDLQAAFQAAHGLKGVLANLELIPLYKPVFAITELLRYETNTDYSDLLKEIKKGKKELENICIE